MLRRMMPWNSYLCETSITATLEVPGNPIMLMVCDVSKLAPEIGFVGVDS